MKSGKFMDFRPERRMGHIQTFTRACVLDSRRFTVLKASVKKSAWRIMEPDVSVAPVLDWR